MTTTTHTNTTPPTPSNPAAFVPPRAGRPRHPARLLVSLTLLSTAAALSVATSRPPARSSVPHHVFIDYCAAGAAEAPATEVLVTNDTNRVVQARFLGHRGGTREIRPGTSAALQLPAGKYAFELNRDGKVLDRKWVELKRGRRYYYFHRR